MIKIEKINFKSKGETCSGLYYSHNNLDSEYCIVMAHGLAGLKEMRLGAYAEKFASHGFDVIIFDYRHFGESEGEPRQLLNIKKQQCDWFSAIRYAMELKNVGSENIILWGSSLSGGHVMEVGSEFQNIAAIIAQVPHVSGLASGLAGDLKTSLRLMVSGLKDCLRCYQGKQPYYVNSSGQPGELAIMTATGEADGYRNLIPKDIQFDQRVAARIVFSMIYYNPGRKLKSIRIPTLVQVALHDKTTPAKATINACSKAASVELIIYDLGHFEPYVEPAFSYLIEDQITFLNRVLNKY